MADQKESSNSTSLLISIETTNRKGLYDSYRDYLVFMSLVRDGVKNYQYQVFGFCWLKNKCLMLIKPQSKNVGPLLLKLLKRYHFWLLQKGQPMTEFRLQMLELKESSWELDSLRFLHQQAVKTGVVDDAMDYHWHSHHVYNGFWSLNWLDTNFILNKFSGNRVSAMSRYREYMQHPHRLDFTELLCSSDRSPYYINKINYHKQESNNQAVAEINSQYHQSLFDRTQVSFVNNETEQLIRITVLNIDSKFNKQLVNS